MYSATLLLLLLLRLVITCHGYSTFGPECSLPSTSVNYVSEPNARGTLDIVFSCVFTVIACTWSIQHLNLPSLPDRTTKSQSVWSNSKWTLQLTYLWSNLKWMLFTILVPEFVLGKALGDLFCACKVREPMKLLANVDRVEWGLEHGFYAGMGGFVGFEQSNDGQILHEIPLTARQIYLLRITEVGTNVRSVSDMEAGRKTYLARLPNITAAEIIDKSKGNIFVKIITVLQVSWVLLHIVVRLAKGLPISPLEVSVAAFSSCSIITYLLLLHKPQGVQVPTRIRCESRSISLARQDYSPFQLRLFFIHGSPRDIYNLIDRERRIPNDHLQSDFAILGEEKDLSFQACLLGFMLGGVIFGSIHIAGWNLTFPTFTERILWRISSIIVTVLLPFTFFPQVLALHSKIYRDFFRETLCCGSRISFRTWNSLLGFVYILARLFMVVEMIRTLFYLAPDSYVSTWASSIPHFS